MAADGTVTFTPEPEFTGTAPAVTVVREDVNGTKASATYTPTVLPITKFVDKEGKEIPGYPTVDGEEPKAEIPGYRFVETKKLPNGDTRTRLRAKLRRHTLTKMVRLSLVTQLKMGNNRRKISQVMTS